MRAISVSSSHDLTLVLFPQHEVFSSSASGSHFDPTWDTRVGSISRQIIFAREIVPGTSGAGGAFRHCTSMGVREILQRVGCIILNKFTEHLNKFTEHINEQDQLAKCLLEFIKFKNIIQQLYHSKMKVIFVQQVLEEQRRQPSVKGIRNFTSEPA